MKTLQENPKINNESETSKNLEKKNENSSLNSSPIQSNRIADKNHSLFSMVYISFEYSITDNRANTLVVNLWKSKIILRQLEISNGYPFWYS